jgi:predicted ATPase
MSGRALDKLTIRGFKSIRELDGLILKPLNVFVGANGTGKSNLISFFRMLRALMTDSLSDYVRESGGIGDLLFNGRKITQDMRFECRFGMYGYRFNIKPGADEARFEVADEARYYEDNIRKWWELGSSGTDKSLLVAEACGNAPGSRYCRPVYDASGCYPVFGGSPDPEGRYCRPVYDAICSWQIYHFHDTGATASMRHAEIVQDNGTLRPDAANIAPFLLRLRAEDEKTYQEVLNACRLVVPYLDDFLLKPQKLGAAEKVSLTWRTKGSDYPMQPYHFSDGSIRFVCLAAALLQPDPPAAIIIDEPELGLHPEAVRVLGELMRDAARRTQIIVATQSPLLLDQFAVEDIVVANRKDGQSVFERLKREDFDVWLEDYSVGELWTKNVIQGGTRHE